LMTQHDTFADGAPIPGSNKLGLDFPPSLCRWLALNLSNIPGTVSTCITRLQRMQERSLDLDKHCKAYPDRCFWYARYFDVKYPAVLLDYPSFQFAM
jgi:hypothetical protein